MIIARLRPHEHEGRKFLQGRITVDHRFRAGTVVSLHKRADGAYELIEWAPRCEGAYDRQGVLSFVDEGHIQKGS